MREREARRRRGVERGGVRRGDECDQLMIGMTEIERGQLSIEEG
jgi:hypothetical protein